MSTTKSVTSARKVLLTRASLPAETMRAVLDRFAKAGELGSLQEFTKLPKMALMFRVPPASRIFAQRREDGFALGVVSMGEQAPKTNLASVDALLLVQPSRTLNGHFADAYIPTVPLPGGNATVSADLESVYPKWKTLQSRRPGPAAPGSLVVHAVREGGLRRQVSIPEDGLRTAGGEFHGDDGLRVAVSVDEADEKVEAVLTDTETRAVLGSASTDSSFYSTVMQQHVQGNYVHGLRSVVGRVRGAQNWKPAVRMARAPQRPLTRQQIASLVKGMGLRCTRPVLGTGLQPEKAKQLLENIGVAPYQPPTVSANVKPASLTTGMSVYPMVASVVAPHIVPPSMLRFLRQQGVSAETATAMLSGAHAVHSSMMSKRLSSPLSDVGGHRSIVDLRALPAQSAPPSPPAHVLQLVSKLRETQCPSYFLHWDSANVGVHVVRMGQGGTGVVFQSTFVASPAARSHPHHQNPMAAFAVYRLEKPTPVAELPADDAETAGARHPWPGLAAAQGLAASAMRLAVVDSVASQPPYTQLQRALRSMWLQREQELLTGDPDYFEKVSVLMQISGLPPGVNYWATVPYLLEK